MKSIFKIGLILSVIASLLACGLDPREKWAKEKVEDDAKEKFEVKDISVDLYDYSDLRDIHSGKGGVPWSAKATINFKKDGKETCKKAEVGMSFKFGIFENSIKKVTDCK